MPLSLPFGIASQSISMQKEVEGVLVTNIVCFCFSPSLPLCKGEEAELRTEIRIWNLLTQRIMDLFCSKNALIVDLFTSALCEGEYQNFGDKAKSGAREVVGRERERIHMCV